MTRLRSSDAGSARRVLVRAAFGALLVLMLGGPTPGAVGSCGTDKLDRLADIQRYCGQREQLICVRRNLRKEISDGQRDDCRRAALAQCATRNWAPECHPTERQARACINALSAIETVKTKEDDIPECSTKALCKLTIVTGPTTAPGNSIDAGQVDAGHVDEDAGAEQSK